jgi:hypothetical protein
MTKEQKIKEEIGNTWGTNTTAGIDSLNSEDPSNPPVFRKKKTPRLLKDVLKRNILKNTSK